MRYWWVNHKQTVRQEIEGGYLWSPKRTKDDKRSQFYDNMARAEPGDAVLSYADARIAYVGQVTAGAWESTKPEEYGPAGENWNNVGWRLPVAWTTLPRAAEPRRHVDELRSLLPAKYSPFSVKARRGNEGAYLAEISGALFNYLMTEAGAEPPRRSRRSRVGERRPRSSSNPAETQRQQNVKVRIGQGLFRTRILEFETGCRITGIENPRLLVASHIKPWRVCTNEERLNGANGLLLTPHIDRLFDRGFISFENDGMVKVSAKLTKIDLERLGLSGLSERSVGTFAAEQAQFLEYHRAKVFAP